MANRLTTFTASNDVTTTLDYDSAGRITRRTNALGYSDYTYVDDTDWLVRETWHSAVSGNVFDLARYWYVNGRPSRAEVVTSAPSDLSAVWAYTIFYLQYNWHGDAVTDIRLDGAGDTQGSPYDPWGNGTTPPYGVHNYYGWNGGWGYLFFPDLNLYYVHGRWWNADTGLWLTPNEKGDYLYGGDGQDAVNVAQADSCENNNSPTTEPIGGQLVDWLPVAKDINFTEAQAINALHSDILASAMRHNTMKTNMDDNSFAALMAAILHWEGKLPGTGKNQDEQLHDQIGDILGNAGFEASVGIAKIRQATALRILKGQIPGLDGHYCYAIEGGLTYEQLEGFATPWQLQIQGKVLPDPITLNRFVSYDLQNPKIALDYLAANLEMGADRINAKGYQASVFNLGTWYNGSIQTPYELNTAPQSVLGYGNSMVATMPGALHLLFGSPTAGRYLPYNKDEMQFVDPGLVKP